MKRISMFLAFALIAAAVPASASDTGFYLGAGIGKPSIDPNDFYPDLGDAIEEDALAFKGYGGFRFFKFLAVEGGYTNLGNSEWVERNVQGSRERAEISVKGWDAYVVGILPVSNSFELYGKLGFMAWDTEIRSYIVTDPHYSDSATGSDTAYGFGAGFWVGPNVTLRAEGEWFKIGDYATVPLYTFNVTYTF
jgi:OOP family OmpA-OmpF porin